MSPEPKSRPVNLKTWQVRAALEEKLGLLVVPMKPRPELHGDLWRWKQTAWDQAKALVSDLAPVDLCPLGQPGERLWGREAWAESASGIVFREDYEGDTRGWGWQPATRLRKVASRLRFEVVSTEVKRAQQITDKEARATGIPRLQLGPHAAPTLAALASQGNYRGALQAEWDRMFREFWGSNPWVWLVGVRRLEVGHA